MYRGEVCQDCGFPVEHFVGSYWYAPNELWNRVMGGLEANDDPGGVLCPPCFTTRCDKLGVGIGWTCKVTREPDFWRPTGECPEC